METSVGGRALQVVKSEDDKSFEVDEDALTKILLDSRVRNSKVMIVSVAGAYRRGKSFLLNFFLKYLKNPGNPDWMGNPNEPLVGFSWKGGSERTTSGILLWSEPFFITLPSGEKVCILLMDTQGAFDSETTVKECATVFAFSTMVSSVQVYNITHNIQEDDLQHLELFTEYGRLALEAYNDKPFQSLHFLVRDWQYPYQHPYGLEGGKVFLERRLEIKEKQAFELQNLRKNISQCFKDIHCFLMPHPGLSVATSATFNGSLADIESDFKTNLKTFTEFLFNPKNVVVKTINGNQITGKELVEYFKSYIKVFQGNILPEPKTMMEATAEANNLAAIANARDLYSREMEKVCEGDKPYLNEKTLADHHDKCFIEAMEQFRKTRKMGGDDFCSTFEVKLESELLELFERYKKNNKAKSVMSTAQTPIFFIALCFLSYVMSGLFSLLGSECLTSIGNILMSLSIVCLFAWCYSRYTGQYRWLGETLDMVARQCSDYFKLGSPPELNLASAAGAVSKAAGAIGAQDRRKDQ